ncbi:MAG: glycosyl transferase [Rhodobiaceae bacterium]|nr:MAG: glycosyl transferase [Rhodobiaceae bacterium]
MPDMSNPSTDKRALRIVHCLRAPIGGLFRHVCDVAQVQSLSGYDVGILCADEPNDPMTEEKLATLKPYCSLGITRISLGRLPGLSDVRALVAGARTMSKTQADIVHGHGAKGGLLARLVYASKPVARIYTPHGGSIHYPPHSLAGLVFGAAERFMLGRTDGLIFESEFARSVFADRFGVLPSNSVVVHNGVAADEFEPVVPVDDASDFVFLGELRELKGIYTLLDAFALLLKQSTASKVPATLSIVGDGPDAAAFRSKIADLGLGSQIRLLGVMSARDAFARGRVVMMPSHRDSFPYVALEAAAAGMPLIATRTGGVPEIFGPCSEKLVAPGDPAALAARMMEYLTDKTSYARTSSLMQERVRVHFSAEKMAAGVLDVYRAALRMKVDGGSAAARSLSIPVSMDTAK